MHSPIAATVSARPIAAMKFGHGPVLLSSRIAAIGVPAERRHRLRKNHRSRPKSRASFAARRRSGHHLERVRRAAMPIMMPADHRLDQVTP